MRVLEISFQPLVALRHPEKVAFVDTRFRWSDLRSYRKDRRPLLTRFGDIVRRGYDASLLTGRDRFDAVVVRALGPENAEGGRLGLSYNARQVMGSLLKGIVLGAVHRGAMLAVVDMTHERTVHKRDLCFLQRAHLYFKRELADNVWASLEGLRPPGKGLSAAMKDERFQMLGAKMRPISLGIDGSETLEFRPEVKKWDVFYRGANDFGIPAREAAVETMRKLKALGLRVLAPEHALDQRAFQRAINESWLCLSPGGIGWDCYRHYEIPLFGSVPVITHSPNLRYRPFVHGKTCVEVSLQEDWAVRVQDALQDKERLVEMSIESQAHTRRWHTFPRLGEHIYSEVVEERNRGAGLDHCRKGGSSG